MTEKWHGGKGSTPSPISNKKQFDTNWDKIFGKLDYEHDPEDKDWIKFQEVLENEKQFRYLFLGLLNWVHS